tara:strand:+ start:1691 stop:1966 length:276 start_codon:yes stop_codon:yes gene_type:complete
MEKQLTSEERIAIIRHAHENSQTFSPTKSVEDFIAEIKTEDVFVEHGLLDSQKEDLEDESQFFLTESAEDIDEEDQEFGLSEEMRNVYENN